MERIKAIVYGVGVIGRVATRYMVQGGIDIVGAIDVNPSIIGKDLGEVAGVGRPLNVKITDDADTILAEHEADIAVVSIFSQLEKMYPIFQKCIENGLSVLTPSEEALYPWVVAPELAAKLDRLAKDYGVTFTGAGLQDVFRVNIVSLLTGSSHTIESITGIEKFDLAYSGPVALANYHMGESKEQCLEKTRGKAIPLNSFKISLHAVVADLGLTITKEIENARPVTDEFDVEADNFPGRVVKKGLVVGMSKITDIETEQGIKFHGEQIFKVFNKAEKAEGGHQIEWAIKGIPTMRVKSSLVEIEAKSAVVSQMVHRIPDILNSEPGFVTIEKLPKLKFKAFPLHYYLES